MRDRTRWLAAAILFVAFALRVGFVLTTPDAPLYWDERLYDSWARVHQGFWSSLISGDAGPSLGDAVRASRQKGEAFVAVVGGIYALAGPNPRLVFYLQALLDTLTCLLIFDLARAMAGARAGVVALAIAALYEPLVFSVARLQTETVSSLLYVAGLWAICVPGRRPGWRWLAGGALLAIAMLAKPALQYLPVVLLPALAAVRWDRGWGARLRAPALVAAGFGVALVPHLLLSTLAVGPTPTDALGNGPDQYGGIIYENAGWKSDRMAFANPPRDALLDALGGDATRRPTHADYRAAVVRTALTHPFETAAVMLHKLYVAWRYPYNDSRATLLFGPAGGTLFHQVMLCLALVGLPLALRRWRVALPLVAGVGYVWFVYLSVKIEARYAVTAMPLMICFAGVAVADLSRGWQEAGRAGARRRVALAAATAAGLVALALAGGVAQVMAWLPVGPQAANGIRVALLLAASGACAHLAAELARPLWPRARAALAPSLALVALMVVAGRPLARDWQEWRSTLTANRGIVGQGFALPEGLRPPAAAMLAIDMLPEPPRGAYEVVVRVAGSEVTRFRGAPTRADANMPGGDYQLLYAVRSPHGEAEKAWYVIAIAPALITPGAQLEVEVALEGAASDGALVVFGDAAPDPATYVGPSLLSPRNYADTSVFKYLVDGDFRLRRRTPLAGGAHSRFHDGVGWTDGDLAFDAGRQAGRYRIFLILAYDHGIVIM